MPEDGVMRQHNTQPRFTQLQKRFALDLSPRSNGTGLRAKVATSRNTLRTSPEDGAGASASQVLHSLSPTGISSTTSNCWWATLASILAAPILLWHTPPCHPIGKTCVAIVGRAGDADGSATGSLVWAALSMHPATPLLLAHRPSCDPIGKTISAIVWVGRSSWHDGHGRHHRRHRHWSDRLRAADVVHPAAPGLLVSRPSVYCPHCAVEGVDWTDWSRLWNRTRRRPWRSWWGCGRRRWRRRWRRSGLWSSGHLGGATNSTGLAAVLLLPWRPYCCGCRDRGAN